MDELTKMRAQVQEVTGIMTQNIEKVLERGEKLETLVDKAADLEANVSVRSARIKLSLFKFLSEYGIPCFHKFRNPCCYSCLTTNQHT